MTSLGQNPKNHFRLDPHELFVICDIHVLYLSPSLGRCDYVTWFLHLPLQLEYCCKWLLFLSPTGIDPQSTRQ